MIIKNERKSYASDLTDSQWTEIKELFPKTGNKSKWEKRELVNAVLYLVENGCKWRNLPHDFPPHTTVSNFYYAAIKSGLWEKIRAALVEKVRLNAGRTAELSYGIIDSQSVKTTGAADELGIDGGKNERSKTPHSSRHYGESACSCSSCCQHSRYKIRNSGCKIGSETLSIY